MDQEWQLHDFKLKSPHHEEKSTGFQTVLQIDPTQKEKEANGEHLRLFWARTLTCIVAPIFVTGYYAAVWARWLNRFDDQGPVAQGPANGRWVYYVWFVTSAVGIGISKYGLAGVEAAMLMDKWWAPSATTHLMAHRNKTWSGPSGWASIRSRPHPTWLLLAFISFLPYLALPLSGFTLELSEGYVTGDVSKTHPSLLGLTKETLLDQNLDDVFTRSYRRWTAASPATLPGRSSYYVPRQDEVTSRSWLQQSPNNWPDNQTITLFIAPQSTDIVSGTAWGFQAQLDCREVSSIDQFKLISQRNSTGDGSSILRCPPITYANSPMPDYYGLPNLCDFDAYTLDSLGYTNLQWEQLTQNFGGFPLGRMEIAVSYNKSAYEDAYSFIDLEPVTIEAALWQKPIDLGTYSDCTTMKPLLSNDLGTSVAGLQQNLSVRGDNFNYDNSSMQVLEAIGIQCRSAFLTGTATLDGPSGTYDNFVIEAPKPVLSGTPVPLATAIPRLFHSRVQAAIDLRDGYALASFRKISDTVVDWTNPDVYGDQNPTAFIASNATWLQSIYRSADTYYQQPLYCDNEDIATASQWQQLQLLNSTQFLNSLLRVHKAYAIEMTKSQVPSFVGNVTTSQLGLVIRPGVLHPGVVMGLLALWTICFVSLGLTFGLRPRWSETLDGFSIVRYDSNGSALSFDAAFSAQDVSKCHVFTTVPGLSGDVMSDEKVGRIRLSGGHSIAYRNRLCS